MFNVLKRKPKGLSRADKGERAASVIVYSTGGLALFLLGWASIAEIDEVTRGDGKVIPSKKTQTIQSSEPGIVQEILVRLGQQVKQGDVLVRLDSSLNSVNLGEVEAKLRTLSAQMARLTQEREGRGEEAYVCPAELASAAPQVCANEANLLASRNDTLRKRISTFNERIEQRQRELNEARQNATRVAESLALAQSELEIIQPMAARNIAPKTELLRAQRAVVELKGQQSALKETVAKIEAALREAQSASEEVELQFRQEALAELTKVSAELSVVRQTARGAEERVRRTDLRSPVDGIVNTLNVNTVGGFVNAGGHVMDIVPLEDQLLIEAKIRPADVAFVRPGQPAMVKITAYDFSIYGGLPGTVEYVSADSVYDEQQRETFFTVQVKTDKATLHFRGKDYAITPGMVSQVEILTGKKTVLDYLMKPILKARHEALTER